MVATAITTQVPTQAGLLQVANAAGDVSNHNSVVNDGHTFVVVENSDSVSRTCTLASASSSDSFFNRAGATVTYTLTAGQIKLAGPFAVNYWGPVLTLSPSNVAVKLAAYSLSV